MSYFHCFLLTYFFSPTFLPYHLNVCLVASRTWRRILKIKQNLRSVKMQHWAYFVGKQGQNLPEIHFSKIYMRKDEFIKKQRKWDLSKINKKLDTPSSDHPCALKKMTLDLFSVKNVTYYTQISKSRRFVIEKHVFLGPMQRVLCAAAQNWFCKQAISSWEIQSDFCSPFLTVIASFNFSFDKSSEYYACKTLYSACKTSDWFSIAVLSANACNVVAHSAPPPMVMERRRKKIEDITFLDSKTLRLPPEDQQTKIPTPKIRLELT